MFELFKILIDNVLKRIDFNKIRERKESQKLTQIGIQLFRFYYTLNNIYAIGIMIRRDLKSFTQWMNRKISEGEKDRVYSSELPQLIEQQKYNLYAFKQSLNQISDYLLVISPNSTNNISAIIHGKINLLSIILRELSEGKFSLFDEEEMENFVKKASTNRNLLFFGSSEIPKPKYELIHPGRLTINELNFFENYLSDTSRFDNLEALKEELDKLYKVICENFSVKDILLKVGQDDFVATGGMY